MYTPHLDLSRLVPVCAQQSHNSNDDCNTYVPCQVEVSYFDRKNTHCVLSYKYEYIVMTAQIRTAATGELQYM